MRWLSESRRRFLFKSFVIGACAPAAWVAFKYAVKDLQISLGDSQILDWVLYSVYLITFPTNVIFLDAERLYDILFLLLIVAPVNGAWYVLVAVLFLFFSDVLQRLRQRGRSDYPVVNS